MWSWSNFACTAGGKGERSAIKPALVMDMLWLCCENEEMSPKKRPKTENEDPVGYGFHGICLSKKTRKEDS